MAKDKYAATKYSIALERQNRLASHIYLIQLEIEEWTAKKWAEDGWPDITHDHLRIIHLLAAETHMNNTELAKQVGVTKQAMSQMIATLVKRGVLKITQNTEDSRSKRIALSDHGLEFDKYFSSSIDELMKEYTSIIGEAKMSVVTDILMELSNGILKKKFERQL